MEPSPKTNAGFLAGGLFSLLLIIGHLIVDALNSWSSQADFALWIIQLVLYFFAGLLAARSQYRRQEDSDEPLLGIVSAGRGAAMIMAVILWVYLIIRSVVLDDPGMFAGFGVFLFIVFMVLDMILALALGTGGGTVIKNQHKPVSD